MGDLEVRLKYKKDDCDDWTKVEDKALRKKIQNRLAKRKTRDDAKRNKRRTEPGFSSPEAPPATNQSPKPTSVVVADVEEDDDPQMSILGKFFSISKVASETAIFPERLRVYLSLPGLKEHRYLQLPQYSLLRAFIRNAETMGLDPFLLYDDDALSPWTVSSPFAMPGPHTLSPTLIQLHTAHHPYLDVIAVPSFRENIIVAILSDEQEDELCLDMHQDSFTVWGSQPWNARSWEVSQAFVDKWWWLLGDEMISQSDFWRGERGESPLKVPVMEVCEITEGT